jgi:hypothetical protein
VSFYKFVLKICAIVGGYWRRVLAHDKLRGGDSLATAIRKSLPPPINKRATGGRGYLKAHIISSRSFTIQNPTHLRRSKMTMDAPEETADRCFEADAVRTPKYQ